VDAGNNFHLVDTSPWQSHREIYSGTNLTTGAEGYCALQENADFIVTLETLCPGPGSII